MTEPNVHSSTNIPTTAQPLLLSYASAPRWWQSTIARRWALLILLLIVALSASRYGPHTLRFVREAYWQRQCMHFNPPPLTAVYERLPFGSASPAIVPPYMDGDCAEVNALHGITQKSAARFIGPRPLRVYRVPVCWVRFLQSSGHRSVLGNGESVVFCHELRTHTGETRLVIVELPASFGSIGDLLPRELLPTVYSPTRWSGSAVTSFQHAINYSGQALPFPRRIFAGQPDPNDPSHFTIEYEWPDGVHGVIDGFLRANEHVDLAFRAGPGDAKSAWASRQKSPGAWEEH